MSACLALRSVCKGDCNERDSTACIPIDWCLNYIISSLKQTDTNMRTNELPCCVTLKVPFHQHAWSYESKKQI